MTAVLAGQAVLAHHALIEVVPFMVPALVVALTVLVLAIQDRRRGRDS